MYLGLGDEASAVNVFETRLVPGLLQTEEYAWEAIEAVPQNRDPVDVNRLVDLRRARQRRLFEDHGPLELWAILDEAVLRRPIGGHDVMQRQLQEIIDVAMLPHVTIQVLPFDKGAHVGLDGPFHVLAFPTAADPDLVHIDGSHGNLYIDRERDVRRYTLMLEHLRAAALGQPESVAFIEGVMKSMS